MKVDFYTNHVSGGWDPGDLDRALGGGEECVILLARELAQRGCGVTVYRTPKTPNGPDLINAGVTYCDRLAFDPWAARDILITWKDSIPHRVGCAGKVKIHWSSDVEDMRPWRHAIRGLAAFVVLSQYHKHRIGPLNPDRRVVIPPGIDTAALSSRTGIQRDNRLALYCSSPDRGLVRLLRDWPAIQRVHHGLKLVVTYGWERYEQIAREVGRIAEADRGKAEITRLADQDGVEWRGAVSRAEMEELYHRARYWMLPLPQADSELFCLAGHKAAWCGAIPVIEPIGALAELPGPRLGYREFLTGKTEPRPSGRELKEAVLSWPEVVERHWWPLLTGAMKTAA